MHPALSIILFTTLSGVGFGTLTWLGFGAVPEDARQAITVAAFIFSVAGLSASSFHLGHPERAWRAFSQWRSSWLSREGVMAVITLGLVVPWWYLDQPRWLGASLAVCALLTVYTTSMIYAQMKSVQQWYTSLTPAVFICMSLASGGLLCALGAAYSEAITASAVIAVSLLLVVAWTVKINWWRRADGDIELSDVASATGLAASGQVRMLESPHSGSSYLLNEMGFRVGRNHARTLRRIALVAGGALPLLALALSLAFENGATVLSLIAILAHLIGVLAERWLFFAEARHAVMSFYD
jgi:DMSO reductase anchor subunit